MKSFETKLNVAVIAILILLVGGLIFGLRTATYSENQIQVSGAERVCTEGICNYLVYTDSGTYMNKDDILSLKFRSSDLHGEFRQGGCFEIESTGFRIGWLSAYPNIIAAERCTEEAENL